MQYERIHALFCSARLRSRGFTVSCCVGLLAVNMSDGLPRQYMVQRRMPLP
jgi:hypothetical protein